MSEVAEVVMDSPAVSEEEVEDQQETLQKDSSPDKNGPWGEIIEGKRAKKSVERLDIQAPKQMKKLKIGDGSGDKLGDIPRTSYHIGKMKPVELRPLHTILYDRPGKMSTIKKNVRQFNGFSFDMDSEQYTKKRDKLLKNSHFTNNKLKAVCSVLDLEKKGTHLNLVDRIMTFLISPKNSGKQRLPTKKKKKSKKKLSGDDSNTKTKRKRKPKSHSSSSSPKKSKSGSKSKAIVMDSSSDEDEDEDDEKVGASAEVEGSDAEEKPSEKEEDQSEKSEQSEEEEDEDDDDDDDEEEEDDDDDDEEESPKLTSGRGKAASKKSAPVKRQRAPAKRTAPPKKRPRKEASELDSASDSDQKPMKKKQAAAKPAAKTKKADSSSNGKKNTNTADDSSDEDEPLIKIIKKGPTDEQLKETVQTLLKEANLEEMTMKQICQKVFDAYSDHDLTSKKDFIKQTVKSLIT